MNAVSLSRVLSALVSGSLLSGISLEEYGILLFWKMTLGVQLGSTVDTHSRVSLRSLRQSLVRRLPPGVQENLGV